MERKYSTCSYEMFSGDVALNWCGKCLASAGRQGTTCGGSDWPCCFVGESFFWSWRGEVL